MSVRFPLVGFWRHPISVVGTWVLVGELVIFQIHDTALLGEIFS